MGRVWLTDLVEDPPETAPLKALFEPHPGLAAHTFRWDVGGDLYGWDQRLAPLALLELVTSVEALGSEGIDPIPEAEDFDAYRHTLLSAALMEAALPGFAHGHDQPTAEDVWRVVQAVSGGGRNWPQWEGWATEARWCGWLGAPQDHAALRTEGVGQVRRATTFVILQPGPSTARVWALVARDAS